MVQDSAESRSQVDDGGEAGEMNITFSDPSDIMAAAQEMLRALKRSSHDSGESEESDLSPEEIEAMKAERRAIIEEIAGKITGIQSHLKNKEVQEIVEEAWETWENEMS